MNELRWILLGAGVALLALIYWQGRRKRLATTESGKPMRREAEAPQLSEAAIVRARRREPAVPISAQTPHMGADDLPEMHATAPATATLSMDEALSTAALDRLTITQPLAIYSNAHNEQAAPVVDEPAHLAPRPTIAATAPRTARKIVALRVPAITVRFDGARLKDAFVNLGLRHGRFGIYHRHDASGAALFSVASIVEPGTFDPAKMADAEYPGVSLFLQLPGSSDGVAAFDAMLECAQALQREFHGGLQGERGKPLTDEIIARIREDIADFQHLTRPASGNV